MRGSRSPNAFAARSARALQSRFGMELTGSRRMVHNMMFATVAWAALFALFLWSLQGGIAYASYAEHDEPLRAFAFPAGNAATIAVAFAVLVICSRPLQHPTLEQAERAGCYLFLLFPFVLCELVLWYLQFATRFPLGEVLHTSAGLAGRAAMGLIAVSGFVFVPLVSALFALERRHRARTALPTAYLYDDAAR